MFDYVNIEPGVLPDEYTGLEFQSKHLDCGPTGPHKYTITKDGTLIVEYAHTGEITLLGHYIGSFSFYHYYDDGRMVEFIAEFDKGKLTSIRIWMKTDDIHGHYTRIIKGLSGQN